MFQLEGFENRLYEIRHGDVFVLNETGVNQLCGLSIRRTPLGKILDPGVMCVEKVKRSHWWQFWKPKYVLAKFMYVEKENT